MALFRASCISSGQVKNLATRPDGQVELKSSYTLSYLGGDVLRGQAAVEGDGGGERVVLLPDSLSQGHRDVNRVQVDVVVQVVIKVYLE